MDLNQERYFILSGAISLSFFVLLLLLVGYSVLVSTKIESFALTQSNFVSVSVAIAEVPAEPQTQAPAQPSPSEPLQESTPPPQPAQAEPVPEISDLFSQVKADKSVKKPKEESKRTEQLDALEKELHASSAPSRFSEKVQKLELVKPSLTMSVQGGSTGPVVNEYHAKIHGLVYTHFHPPAGSGGQAVRLRMKISASGKLISYKVIAYSGYSALNSEVDWLRERLASVQFPVHPEGRDTVLDFILTPKE